MNPPPEEPLPNQPWPSQPSGDPELVRDPSVDARGLRACRQALQSGDCRSIRYYAEIDSTNSAACRDLNAGGCDDDALLPRLYLADAQTAGRGRSGRQWLADGGTLTFSLVYAVGEAHPPALPAAVLPLVGLATGVAIARGVEYLAAPVTARIKWPNDIHVGGGKIAGVLVESVASRSDRVVIGVGLNVATDLQRFADAVNAPARSLSQIVRGPIERYEWLAELLSQLRQAYEELAVEPQQLLQELRRRCLLTGSEIRYQSGGAIRRGAVSASTAREHCSSRATTRSRPSAAAKSGKFGRGLSSYLKRGFRSLIGRLLAAGIAMALGGTLRAPAMGVSG